MLKCETNDILRTKACIFRSYFQCMYFSLGGHFSRGVHTEALGYKRSLEGGGGAHATPARFASVCVMRNDGHESFTLPCLTLREPAR